MDLEEAKKRLNRIITTKFNNDYSIDSRDKEAIEIALEALNNSVSKDEIKEVIQRIDYDVKKTREVKTEKNNSYCSNDYDKVRLKAYITKSNEIKRRLLELLNKGE